MYNEEYMEYTFVLVSEPSERILEIYQSNDAYFMIAEGESATMNDVITDIQARPKTNIDYKKGYTCIKKDDQMIGVADFLMGYPSEDCLYIGLFMLDRAIQNQGIGSDIIQKIQANTTFSQIRLGVLSENLAALHFWKKHGFIAEEVKEIKNNHGNNVSVIRMYWNGRDK